MYSTLEYLLSPRSTFNSRVYVISDSQMQQLELDEYQTELASILDQRKRLETAYQGQVKWLQEREALIRKDIHALSPSTAEALKDTAKKADEGIKDTVSKAVDSGS
tara:strand:+ start:4920 stop:5237 length:318 start_codon:yes stop_codon:yes gene_type:complete